MQIQDKALAVLLTCMFFISCIEDPDDVDLSMTLEEPQNYEAGAHAGA